MTPRPTLFDCPSRNPRALPIYSNVSVGVLELIRERRKRSATYHSDSVGPLVLVAFTIRAAQMDALNLLIPEDRKT